MAQDAGQGGFAFGPQSCTTRCFNNKQSNRITEQTSSEERGRWPHRKTKAKGREGRENKNKPWPRTPGKAAGQQARWRGTKATEEVGAVRANNTDQKQRNLTGDSCHPSVLEHGPRTKKCVTRDTYGTADLRGAEKLQTRAQTRRMQGNAQTVRKVPLHIPSQKQVQRTIIRVWDTELHNQMF